MADEQTPVETGTDPQDLGATTGGTPDGAPADPPAATEAAPDGETPAATGTTRSAPRKKAAARKRTAKKAASPEESSVGPAGDGDGAGDGAADAGSSEATGAADADQPAAAAPTVKKTTRKRATKKAVAADDTGSSSPAPGTADSSSEQAEQAGTRSTAPTVLFQPPPAAPAPSRRRKATPAADDDAGGAGSATEAADADGPEAGDDRPQPTTTTRRRSQGRGTARGRSAAAAGADGNRADEDEPAAQDEPAVQDAPDQQDEDVPAEQDDDGTHDGQDDVDVDDESDDGAPRRRRRRGGRRRRGKGGGQDGGDDGGQADPEGSDADDDSATGSDDGDDGSDGDDSTESQSSSSRRRRRRRRSGDSGDDASDDSGSTVTKVRTARAAEDEITTFTGSTRLEAKKQRRREGREAGRRRAPVISEAEFLARRESVERKMVVRQRDDLTQIAVMEDKVLVEHYVARDSQTSLIGNVYLGRVQNVLPSMEAAFIDIGRGRNAVLYAGEVNWDALGGGGGKERKIEQVLKPGQAVLVQVTKDPIGHKGARLTSQISLPGRFLVYVPEGSTSGISRKLPDTERNRLKNLLKEIVPSEAGVIVRTAAEGAAEDELRRDVARLTARWEDIRSKVEGGNAPQELYREPDLTLKVVRDLFTEDIGELVVSGAEAWEMVSAYVDQVAPDLVERLTRHNDSEADAFSAYRIDEQIAKALERKVWLPSGGSLIIDRTEAMTVVDVNTGKFTGSGGNLEETVTKNNLEAAEEIVRQLRLRDIGGIIVIDFIDMVLESNRDLVLRRLIECLGRDRTRHQVAEVTSLGLVQMTRKRIGTGLLEAFSEQCEHCQGRGYHLHAEPVEQKKKVQEDDSKRGRRTRRGKSDDQDSGAARNDRDAGRGRDDRNGARNAADGPRGGNGAADADHGENGARRPTPAEFAAMAKRQAEAGDGDGEAVVDGQGGPVVDDAAPSDVAPADVAPSEVAPSDVAPTSDPAPEPAPERAAPESTPEPAAPETGQAQAGPEPPAVPEGPRIVTSTRRRGARRAAGPPRGEPEQGPT